MRFIITILLAAFTYMAIADQPPSEESVRELLEVMEAHTMSDEIIDQVFQMFEASSEQALGDVEQSPQRREIMRETNRQMSELMREHLRWETMEADMIAIYTNHFTQSELDAMIDFYRTDAGQSVIQKMPVVMHESMRISQERMQQILPEIAQIQQEAFMKLRALSAEEAEVQ